MFSSIKVKAPSSTANLGSSFDCLAIALNLYNSIIISISDREDVFIYNGNVSTNSFIFKIVNKFFEFESMKRPNLIIEINNEIPLSRGLGSSSAAIISTLVAINGLFLNDKYSIEDILNIAIHFEEHPDNLSAACFGGLVLSAVNNKSAFHYKFNEFNENFVNKTCLLIVPNYEISTYNSRTSLFNTSTETNYKEYIDGLNKAILNIISFASGRFSNLFYSMDDNIWHQNKRKKNIKFYDDIYKVALTNGAIGFSISGSGPSILVIVDDKNIEIIKDSILAINNISDINPKFLSLKPDYEGVQILWKK